MRKLCLLLAVVAVAVTACQKDVVYNNTPKESESVELAQSNTRTYDEALEIAEDALKLLEGEDTRSAKRRVIKRNEGQVVMRPVTRGSETAEEPIMYVFNNENDEGFTVVAANRSQQPLIAVTEQGNYTYGESTGVEPFDLMMEDVATTLSTIPKDPTPITPINPTSGYYKDTVDIYNRVEPLISTKWHQEGIFGAEFSNYKSGCATTAFGQIMAYYGYPSVLLLTYNNNQFLQMNWSDIRKVITGNETFFGHISAKESIGKLLREIGERMDVNPDTSGTNNYDIWDGIHDLGYTSSSLNLNTSVSSQFYPILYSLKRGCPVMVTGLRNAETGHAWVADGIHQREYGIYVWVPNPNYDPSITFNNPEPEYIVGHVQNEVFERLVHYNWGAPNGLCNGWFAANCYSLNDGVDYDNDNESQIIGNPNYNLDICVIYDIQPSN